MASRVEERNTLLSSYRTGSSGWDELVDGSGRIRPHWDFLIQSLESVGPAQLSFRQSEIRRFIRENGVTYNVFDSSGGREREWPLDIMPVLMDSREWAEIERGLIQRAELLDLILRDLYGPRRLIAEGHLPAEVIIEHGGFLRASNGLFPPDKRFLHFYAADLARGPDGKFLVISDRVQSPSGAGYALENRIVLSRTLPSIYRDSHVHRLALFFRSLRNHMSSMTGGGNRLALLTPGPENETYFEQAFLANYLGFNLVRGADLTVRDGRVFLKTLNGLRQVDGILRRVDDVYADPLELKGDSLLGAAGLMYAMRAGSVSVINPPGVAVIENPGLYPFLPAICKHLLGQDLRLESARTMWCGRDTESILGRLHDLVVKPISSNWENRAVNCRELSKGELDVLKSRIRSTPWSFVAQEVVSLSSAPLWMEDHFEPRKMVVRSYACARDDSFAVMPGGLVRVSPDPDAFVVTSQRGGVSKDLWILASEPEKQVSLISSVGETPLVRSSGEIPSSVADNLFWVGRYAERTEGLARILREILLRLAEFQRDDEGFAALLAALEIHVGPMDARDSAGMEKAATRLLVDAAVTGSVRWDVRALITAGRGLRERLSEDAWRTLNRIEPDLEKGELSPIDSVENVLLYLSSFSGFVAESMTRGQGHRFLELGRRIERTLLSLDLLLQVIAGEPSESVLELPLRIQNSYMTYRRRYKTKMDRAAVIDLLVFDESNPRSVAHQLLRLEELTRGLPDHKEAGRNPESRIARQGVALLRLAEETVRTPAEAPAFRELLIREKTYLRELSDTMTTHYFRYVETQQRLEAGEWSVTT